MMCGGAVANPTDGSDFRYTFGISSSGVQLSNGAIKFQGRISQGKMPISQGEIMSVSVNLLDSHDAVKCSHDYGKVTVTNSILNLDFQPTNCVLDNTVALNPDLKFQLVINGSPLKAIAIGTVPYALKANYAVKAEEVHFADVAAQAHYAHRITADRQALAVAPDAGVGTGYFDFYTHPTGGSLYGTAYSQYQNDGFIQWTPLTGSPVLHIAAKTIGDDQLSTLDGLHLESRSTVAHGSVTIDPRDLGSPAVPGPALTVNQWGATINGLTKLNSGAEVSGGLLVKDYLGPGQALVCEGDAKVESLTVNGTETVGGTLTVAGVATLNGGSTIKSGLTVSDMLFAGMPAFVCNGEAQINKHLAVLSVGVKDALVVTKTSRFDGAVTVSSTGTFKAAGPAQFGEDGGTAAVDFIGPVNFSGPVTIKGALSGSIPTGSVTNEKIAQGAVTADKIADGGVTTEKIARGAITAEKLAPGAVSADSISPGTVPKWTSPTLTASFGPAYSGYPETGWYRDTFRRVHVVGAVSAAAPGTAVMWTFPVGYRPAKTMPFFYTLGSQVLAGHVNVDGTVALAAEPSSRAVYEFAFEFLAEQ
jgi:hypothetical protein